MKNIKRLSVSGLIAVVLVCFGVLANWYLVQGSDNQSLEAFNPYQELYDELLRPSVMVSTPSGTGSGVVISSTNKATYILSAAHVVGNESEVTVEFYSYRGGAENAPRGLPTVAEIKAHVVATDTAKDLALIRAYSSAVRAKRVTADYSWQYSAKAELPDYTYKPYPYIAKLAPRNYAPRIFTPIWVIGCSLGLPPRPTEGTITSINNHWGINAPIWPGNSGGGAFLQDTNELIGIAILVKVYQGQLVSTMGSIVPLDEIYKFLQRAGERLAVSGKRFALIDTPTPNISNQTPQTTRGSD